MSDPCANVVGSQPSSLVWRAGGFVATFTVLQLLRQQLSGSRLEYFVIHTCTVEPAALLANVLTPDVHASASGYLLQALGVRLNILNGCDGLEALFLVVAAFTVAPLDWRRRTFGAALGVPVVFAVNQARILTLFYAFRSDPALFASLHATVTPIAVVVLVCCYFYAWLAYPRRHPMAATA